MFPYLLYPSRTRQLHIWQNQILSVNKSYQSLLMDSKCTLGLAVCPPALQHQTSVVHIHSCSLCNLIWKNDGPEAGVSPVLVFKFKKIWGSSGMKGKMLDIVDLKCPCRTSRSLRCLSWVLPSVWNLKAAVAFKFWAIFP